VGFLGGDVIDFLIFQWWYIFYVAADVVFGYAEKSH
jgi:hypothetical protein